MQMEQFIQIRLQKIGVQFLRPKKIITSYFYAKVLGITKINLKFLNLILMEKLIVLIQLIG